MSVADKDEHCMCVAATTRETLCMLNMSWRETALELMQAMGFFFLPSSILCLSLYLLSVTFLSSWGISCVVIKHGEIMVATVRAPEGCLAFPSPVVPKAFGEPA